MSRKVEPYSVLSDVYDSVSNVEAKRVAVSYLLNATGKRGHKATVKILDLASGTGNVALLLLAEGVHVLGLDCSDSMLRLAKKKLAPYGTKVTLLKQDLRDLVLNDIYDGAICLSFSLCYLTDELELTAVISSIARVISKDGLFLFDMLDSSAPDSDWLARESARWQRHGVGWEFQWLDRSKLTYAISFSISHMNGLAIGESVTEVHKGRTYSPHHLRELFQTEGSFILEEVAQLRTSSLNYFIAQRV